MGCLAGMWFFFLQMYAYLFRLAGAAIVRVHVLSHFRWRAHVWLWCCGCVGALPVGMCSYCVYQWASVCVCVCVRLSVSVNVRMIVNACACVGAHDYTCICMSSCTYSIYVYIFVHFLSMCLYITWTSCTYVYTLWLCVCMWWCNTQKALYNTPRVLYCRITPKEPCTLRKEPYTIRKELHVVPKGLCYT